MEDHDQNLTNGGISEITDDTPALLCTVNDHMELAGVESLLRGYGIPMMTKWRNGGDLIMVYMSASYTGADIYVPSKLLEKAKGLLSAENKPNGADTPDNAADVELAKSMEKQEKIRRGRAFLILFILFILPVLLGVIMVIMRFINK